MAEGTTPLTAYLQLVPKLDPSATKSNIVDPVGSSGTAAGADFGKKMLKAVAALGIGKAIVDSIKTAFNGFADYEQLAGGVETLFKDSNDAVLAYANSAYKTAGMSANQYLETVTSFSASLIQGLNGDTAEAAEIADVAITDMADNANKMGTSIESLQVAYAGFAKQNYTMLDNLKLGYGGTKSEMERLLADAEALSGISYDIDNYADIIEAIHVIQEDIGITGATALEAEGTISGSLASLSASYQNFLAGMGQDSADISRLTNELVNSLVVAAQNIIPRVFTIVENLFASLPEVITSLTPALMEFITNGVQDLPELLEAGFACITQLALGIANAIPELTPALIETITSIADTLTSPDNLVPLVSAALALIIAVSTGLIESIPKLLEAVPSIVGNLANSIVEAVPQIIEAGKNLLLGMVQGFKQAIPRLIESIRGAVSEIINAAKRFLGIASPSKVFAQIGEYSMEGLANGFENGEKYARDALEDSIGNITAQAAIGVTAGVQSGANVTINAAINASSLADVATVQQLVERLNASRTAQTIRLERMGAAYGY